MMIWPISNDDLNVSSEYIEYDFNYGSFKNVKPLNILKILSYIEEMVMKVNQDEFPDWWTMIMMKVMIIFMKDGNFEN